MLLPAKLNYIHAHVHACTHAHKHMQTYTHMHKHRKWVYPEGPWMPLKAPFAKEATHQMVQMNFMLAMVEKLQLHQ